MTLTAEQLEIRDLARDFAANEITPFVEEWDRDRQIPDELFQKLAELGFLGMLIPEAYGGLELDVCTCLVVLEELARADASVALSVAIHNGAVPGIILAHGTEEQKTSWLPRLAAGEILGTVALSDAEAGADADGLTCTATRSGAGWTLNGSKPWVTNGQRAGLVVLFAAVGDAGELGCFLVEPGADGYSVARRLTTMGHRASETVDVELSGLSLGGDALLGEAGRGLAYAAEGLVLGRTAMAAQALGVAQASLDHATRYSLERKQFGRTLADFEATQAKLANMAARIAGCRAAILEVGARLEEQKNGAPDLASGADALAVRAAGAKLLASETAMYASDEAVQIFGGYGYMRDYPVERLMRDAKGTELFEGTSEVLRVAIAREIIRAASDD